MKMPDYKSYEDLPLYCNLAKDDKLHPDYLSPAGSSDLTWGGTPKVPG